MMILLLWIVGAISALVYFAVTFPLQTDEIQWAFINHRAVLDHYQVMSLYPQCGTKVFSTPLVPIAYPAAWINHLIYLFAESPFFFRLLGLARLLLGLSLFYLIARRLAGKRALLLFGVSLTFLLLDSTSVLLVVARPEQSLLLGALIILLMVLSSSSLAARPLPIKILLVVVFFLTVIQVAYAHAKAVGFIPFFVVSAFLLSAANAPSRFGVFIKTGPSSRKMG